MPRRMTRREMRRRQQRRIMLAKLFCISVVIMAVIGVFAYYINDYRKAVASGNNTASTNEADNTSADNKEESNENKDDETTGETEPDFNNGDNPDSVDISKYQEDLDNAVEHNAEVSEYAKHFAEKLGTSNAVLTDEEMNEEHPLFIQWDDRWGYAEYGESVIGLAGCGPTCLSMVAVALTHNENCTPLDAARYSMEQGYCLKSSGTTWDLFAKGADGYGLISKELPLDEYVMKNALDSGKLLVLSMGPGDFTTQGHYLVVYGYDEEGFMINDPNSRTRSAMRWEYNCIHDQIRNLWSFEAK